MLGKFEAQNTKDEKGNPTGGHVSGVGLSITWQDGPLGRGKERKEPNGAFVETVIAAAMQRLEFYQASQFKCTQNELAIKKLKQALDYLDQRTKMREKAGTEGTHKA